MTIDTRTTDHPISRAVKRVLYRAIGNPVLRDIDPFFYSMKCIRINLTITSPAFRHIRTVALKPYFRSQ